jgi:putative oxidoreductase
MYRSILRPASVALMALLFTYAGFSKFLRLSLFNYQMHNQVFPLWMVPIITWTVPLMELIIVGLLFFPGMRQVGLWAAFLLMSLFSVYIGLVLLHVFHRIPCSCGGVINHLGWREHLLFNLFFTEVAWIGVWSGKKRVMAVEGRQQDVSPL